MRRGEIFCALLFLCSMFILLSLVSDQFLQKNLCGRVGDFVSVFLFHLFGKASYLLPFSIFFLLVKRLKGKSVSGSILGFSLLLLTLSAFLGIFTKTGILGEVVLNLLYRSLYVFGYIVIVFSLILSALLAFDVSLKKVSVKVPKKKKVRQIPAETEGLPISFLKDAPQDQQPPAQDVEKDAQILEDTLSDFGIDARVSQIHRGPTVTRFEITPSSGTKISSITSLADDIALALAAPAVRIEAPIPGKQAIGVEVPSRKAQLVCIKDIITSKKFMDCKSPLAIALGKDITGQAYVADLRKLPHLLVAGTTGSGKSVCISCIITSILYKISDKISDKADEESVRFLMIDPKLVELSIFDGLPHLIGRIINTAEDAKKALGWLVEEMEHRYRILAQHYVRDIDTYIKEGGRMPYIVVIVDELADLMLTSAHECEDRIVRLAQMARAVGIHLVLATQRPSVDVVTGIIKANVPGRIAFYLASKADSRTILDRVGAEKLLGQGDMLYIEPGMQKPIRIQGSYISNAELTLVVSHLRKRRVEEDHLSASLLKALQQKEREGIDPLYEEAKKIAMEEENLSVSLLQRKLRVGFNRAARLMEQLREEGVFQKE